MRELTRVECETIISTIEANFNEKIYVYVPNTQYEQPLVMYVSKGLGETKHYLSNSIKKTLKPGMHCYNGDTP